ncbi:GNAT family N-acetyltransferase [Deinococcus koreensis]|uniref:N-acetyltransferase n=1 Tax=Deinococcus koreensis TaxID=2054903 RepID=A0A2K3V1P6_9DEIO|nr:GNAT family protein [Deinococcus koreensis]PNY82705.1 N-acetyltransferase [Deinococcus koreensis]
MALSLRPLRWGDEEVAVRWGADDEFCLATGWTPRLPPGHLREHWQGILATHDPGFLRLGIERDGALVGFVDLAGLDGQSAEFGIAIGERALWGQGVGRAAGRLLLGLAFAELGLRQVRAEVHLTNARSHALMRRLGFVAVGQGQSEEYRGAVVPLVRYALQREDFASRRDTD